MDKDERGLIKIIEAAQKFEEDRFLEGIRQRCYTAEDIQVTIDQIREYQAKLDTEARALVYFSQTFLQQYATNNNSCFETAHLLFNRIRSTLKASRAVFRKTCPIRRRLQPAVNEKPSIYLRSVLANGDCNRDLFGILSYEDSVQTLYSEMQAFFTTIITTLGLCRYMMKMEQAIREDGDRCEQIYKDCEKKALNGIREVTKLLTSVKVLPESELSAREGIAMLSGLLRSEIAIQANINIMRAFFQMQEALLIVSNTQLQLEQIRAEIKQLRTDMNDTLADQNDINEMTRVQLEAISDVLIELQNQGKNPLVLPEIGYTAIQKRREEEVKE